MMHQYGYGYTRSDISAAAVDHTQHLVCMLITTALGVIHSDVGIVEASSDAAAGTGFGLMPLRPVIGANMYAPRQFVLLTVLLAVLADINQQLSCRFVDCGERSFDLRAIGAGGAQDNLVVDAGQHAAGFQ